MFFFSSCYREHLINYYDKLTTDVESDRARTNWRKMRMSHFEKRVEHLKSVNELDGETPASVGAPGGPDEDTINTDERSEHIPISPSAQDTVSTSEAEVVASSQDENSNFPENEVSNQIATTDDVSDNRNDAEENLSVAKSVSSGKAVASNVEIMTSKDSLAKSLPMNYIYKRNNERSNLQDFLRDEAMKNIRTIINDNEQTESDEITEKLVGTINRPRSLAIEKIDNMSVAQTNKLKVLLQEYGMTPNNNELSTILSEQGNRTNINGNNEQSFGETKETAAQTNKLKVLLQEYGMTSNNDFGRILSDKRGNVNRTNVNGNNEQRVNNNVPSTPDVKLSEEEMTNALNRPIDNEECSNRINDVKEQDSILNSVQRQNSNNNIDTPMSCTTDNFTTLSTHTPLSQIPNSDDIFALNSGQESSPSDMTKSMMTEVTCFESPMSGHFKLPNLFGVVAGSENPNPAKSSPSSLTIADVEMIDHTSLQVYLEKSIIIPLQIQTRLVNDAIIKHLVNECNMLSHLRSLRSYFFLLNGEFAKSLTNSLYSRLYAISAPMELFNSATLANLLKKALMNSFSNNYANSELLSLSAVDQPNQLYVSV